MLEINKIHHGCCLELMKDIPDGSIDMVLTDPPYGTTACKWDSVLDLDLMWKQLNRVIKLKSAIAITASQPFTSVLVNSNIQNFKYEWIWEKAVGSNFAVLKYQPMKEHESILIFSNKTHNYYPIKQPRKGSGAKRMDYGHNGSVTGEANGQQIFDGWDVGKYDKNLRNPSSVQYFNNREKCRGLHPTQKPVDLMEYLIKTYTLEGETVLDFTIGSGTTAVAAIQTHRNFIGIEKEQKYVDIARQRISRAEPELI